MSSTTAMDDPYAVVRRLVDAINAHDLDAMVDCFATDFAANHPTTPEHSVTSDANVRENWTEIFAAVPDISWEVQRHVVAGDTVWAEAEQRGTTADGGRHLVRGVVIFEVTDGRFRRNTLYMSPVRSGGPRIGKRD
jgi:ketosteroid isomerase-like protein